MSYLRLLSLAERRPSDAEMTIINGEQRDAARHICEH
jgi:hypothetical protein